MHHILPYKRRRSTREKKQNNPPKDAITAEIGDIVYQRFGSVEGSWCLFHYAVSLFFTSIRETVIWVARLL